MRTMDSMGTKPGPSPYGLMVYWHTDGLRTPSSIQSRSRVMSFRFDFLQVTDEVGAGGVSAFSYIGENGNLWTGHLSPSLYTITLITKGWVLRRRTQEFNWNAHQPPSKKNLSLCVKSEAGAAAAERDQTNLYSSLSAWILKNKRFLISVVLYYRRCGNQSFRREEP